MKFEPMNKQRLAKLSKQKEYSIRKNENKKVIRQLRKLMKQQSKKGLTKVSISVPSNDSIDNKNDYFALTEKYFRSRGFSVTVTHNLYAPTGNRVLIAVKW